MRFALYANTAQVKLHSNPVIQGGWKQYERYYSHLPNVWLPNAQFSLVVFLSMASSSSHLACKSVQQPTPTKAFMTRDNDITC